MEAITEQCRKDARRNRRRLFSVMLAVIFLTGMIIWHSWTSRMVLRITDWKTGEVYAEAPVRPGDALFFGWRHSLEKIPWNEYYHIAANGKLVLDQISFPAFGAGIPENKGRVCRVEAGMIYMDEIGQVFEEFVWLNSHYSVREIKLNNRLVTCGELLPEHTRVRLEIEWRKPRYE